MAEASTETLIRGVFKVDSIKTTTMQKRDGSGTFETLEIVTTDGRTLNGYLSQLEGLSLQQNDEVFVTAQRMTRQDGTTYNKILKLRAPSEANASSQSTPPWISNNKKAKTFDNKSAREGGIMHDAVAIAIHNAAISKKPVDLGDVEQLSVKLLDIINKLGK